MVNDEVGVKSEMERGHCVGRHDPALMAESFVDLQPDLSSACQSLMITTHCFKKMRQWKKLNHPEVRVSGALLPAKKARVYPSCVLGFPPPPAV